LQTRVASLSVLMVLAAFPWIQDTGPLERARRLATEGRTAQALAAFDAVLRDRPTDKAVLREAATVAFRERRWFEAARLLDRLVALDPADPAAWYDLGALRHNQCRFDLAIPVFRQLETLEGSDRALAARAEHRFLHGESSRRLEQFGEAIAELSVATARAPDRVDYRKSLAQALLDGGRFEAAAAEFATVAKADPVADNYFGLGSALSECGRTDEAISALREARRLRNGDGRTLLKLATLSTWKKDLGRAEAYLIEARQASPRNMDVLFALAQVERLQGRLEESGQTRAAAEAIKKEADAATERGRVFSRGFISNPNDVDAHLRYALDLLGQSRFDDAQLIFQKLLSFDPENQLAILNLATLLARQGDPASARKELTKILEKDEGHEIANLQAARLCFMTRDPSGALDHLRRVVARNPDNITAHELLAATWRALGDPEAAAREDAIRKTLSRAESRPETR
jgi:Flp pilus assembly protein TadD